MVKKTDRERALATNLDVKVVAVTNDESDDDPNLYCKFTSEG
jgi:hypothetical protein